MKKKLAFMLAVISVMSVPSAAAETNDGTEPTVITVGADYTDAKSITMSADITWEEMSFEYTAGSQQWNAAKHSYNEVGGGWSDETKSITIANHSNADIKAEFTFNTAVEGLNAEFDKPSVTLPTAEGTTYENAPKTSVKVGMSGAGITDDRSLGSISVTIERDYGSTIDADGYTLVTTPEGFEYAVSNGDNVRLANDIKVDYCGFYANTVIDLNGKTLTGVLYCCGDVATIKNGTISGGNSPAVVSPYETDLTIENCTLRSDSQNVLNVSEGTAKIKNCSMECKAEYSIYNYKALIELSGEIKANKPFDVEEGTITALEGVYDFDPTEYVDTSNYKVTNNGASWTVTKK